MSTSTTYEVGQQWSHSYDGDRYHIREAGNGDCVAHADTFQRAETIVTEHNQHAAAQSLATELATQAEQRASTLARVVGERDEARDSLAMADALHQETVQARIETDHQNRRLKEALELTAKRIDFLTNWIENTYGGSNPDVELGRKYAAAARAALTTTKQEHQP